MHTTRSLGPLKDGSRSSGLRRTCLLVAALSAFCATASSTPAPKSSEESIRPRLREVMAEQVQAGFWGVVYISKGDDVLLHEGYGLSDRHTQTPMRKDTVIDAGSFSKQVTAAAAVKLASAGKLSLQDPLSK